MLSYQKYEGQKKSAFQNNQNYFNLLGRYKHNTLAGRSPFLLIIASLF